MNAEEHPWEAIYRSQGCVFQQILPFFAPMAAEFRRRCVLDLGCGRRRGRRWRGWRSRRDQEILSAGFCAVRAEKSPLDFMSLICNLLQASLQLLD